MAREAETVDTPSGELGEPGERGVADELREPGGPGEPGEASPPAAKQREVSTEPPKRTLTARLLGWLQRTPRVLSKVYFGLLSGAFSREHQAVLSGIFRYYETEKGHEANRFLLRRNVHRLEKGLLMRPRRTVFALSYIDETVEAFVQATAARRCGGAHGHSEWQWAHDVLCEFFAVTDSHPKLDPLRDRFRKVCEGYEAGLSKPYRRDLGGEPPVSYDDMLALARRRRSVRWYQPRPVPRELVDKAILVAAQAPSACNRQPFVFRIFDDPERVKALAELPMGTRGFSQNFPMILAVVGRLRAYFSPRDRHLVYIDGSLAAMSLMLALETVGLSSCAINWPDMKGRERKVAEIIGLEGDERVIMLMSIGYPDPDGLVAYSQKKDLDELRTYNE